MKLLPRKSGYLASIITLVSLTALALVVYTVSLPLNPDHYPSDTASSVSPDSLNKARPQPGDTAYNNLLRKADACLKANNLQAGLDELEKAQKLKPTDKTVNARIAQVKGMISANGKKQADFMNSVVAGDAAFQKKDYLNAKAYYQIALNLVPGDSAAKEKLKKTMDLIRSQKASNTLYDVAVANADRLFQAGEYDKANEEYQNASHILPSEQYPKQKINEIVKIRVEQQMTDGEYTTSIKNGDQYYNAKNWQPALLEYRNASKIKPLEKYPKDRIAELTLLVADQRAKDEAYTKLIVNADQLFASKSYAAARKDYLNASKLKPDQGYPKNKIIEIDRLLASMSKTQKDYEQYISLADSFYIDKNFIRARDYYTLALNVKPGESYPKTMLEKVNPMIAGQEAGEKAKEASYQSAIAVADKEFSGKNYEQAKTEYLRASGIKPAEAYPKGKIAEIDKLVAEQKQAELAAAAAKQAELEKQKQAELAAAAAKQAELEKQKQAELAASAAKQAELEKQQAELAKAKQLDDDYQQAVKTGDSLITALQYAPAKTAFTKASALKPAETYPKDKLALIAAAMADMAKQQALDKQYQADISAGDKLLASKSYTEAKTQYKAALVLKPGEAYPGTKIAEIDNLLEAISKQKALDGEYAGILASGEKLFKARSWDQAKTEYQKALALKPDEVLPKRRIASIDSVGEVLMKQKSLEEQYTGIITNADQLLAAKTYDQARQEYQKASAMKPSETYPKLKIQEIDKQLAEIARLKKLDEDYNLSVKIGDSLLAAGQYAQARVPFTKASALKPSEAYPKEKLAAISTALADLAKQKELDQKYQAAIASADKLLQGKSYNDAKAQYIAALVIKPGEAYPTGKIGEIDKTLVEIAKQKALDSTYSALIVSGEKLFKAKALDQAKSEFQNALTLKPGESLPKKRIASIDSIGEVILKQKSLDEQYSGIISNADKLLASKTLDQARAEYLKASALKPSESYPKTKIQEIDKQLAEIARLKKLEDDYNLSVKSGDSLLAANQYAQAKVPFTKAAALKPAESYPKTKLDQIDKALADLAKQKELDQKYQAALTSADKLLESKSYNEARAQYTAALALKPGEAYPTGKISEIHKTLAEIAKQKALDSTYSSIMVSGEKLFTAKSLDPAKTEFQKALALKPAEALPKQRINSIDSIAEVIRKQKSLDEQYTGLIANADKLIAAKSYEPAKAEYLKASELKPSEAYPKSKIQEIEKQLAEIARLKKLDDDYKTAVSRGDSLLGANQYAPARTAFADAAALKPAEAYPKTKLAQVDKAIADQAKQKAVDEKYQAAIALADKLLESKSYTEARAQYTAALAVKPGEAYPTGKISEIDKTLAEIAKQKARDEQYNAIISSGEKFFNAKSLAEAKGEYQKALALKPDEQLPKQRITSIDSLNAAVLAARKARDSSYSATIISGDKLLAAKSFEEARAEYQKAIAIKADELYPKTKISEIDKAVADISRQKAMVESRYKASVTKADQLLASKSYEPAKAEYNNALSIKAGEQYPQDKIKEIDIILAEIKARDDSFKASLAKADQMLLEKKYEDARTEYENALTIKPTEQYPTNKIDEINKKLADVQGRKKTFDDLVSKGDNAFGSKDYGKAREFLQQATVLFPEEVSAKSLLDRVNHVIDSLYRANKGKYDKAIGEADKFYNGFEFDKAIDAYTEASAFLPMENYPREMIARIHKTLAENAIADVLNSTVTIASNEEKQFKFTPVNIASRKDNFIYIKLRNLSGKPFSVLLRYGKDKQPSGGVVIRNLSIDGKVNERLISVREQDVWYRIDNDFISLYPQGGDIEVSFIQVSKAR